MREWFLFQRNNPINYTDPTGNMSQNDAMNLTVALQEGQGIVSSGYVNSSTPGGATYDLNQWNYTASGTQYSATTYGLTAQQVADAQFGWTGKSWSNYSIAEHKVSITGIPSIESGDDYRSAATGGGTDGNPGGGSGDGTITYAPRGSIEDGTTYRYTKTLDSSNTWCNVYVNNTAIDRGGHPETDTLINRIPSNSYNLYTGPNYNASRTKSPFANTRGYVYYFSSNPRYQQPQHVEYYENNGLGLYIWNTTGAYNAPPPAQGVPFDINNLIDAMNKYNNPHLGFSDFDYWFVPLEPLD